MIEDAFGFVLAAFAFVVVVFVVVAAGSTLAVAAVPGAIGYAIYWHKTKSPTAKERQAKALTEQLYRATKAQFTTIDIPTFIGNRIGRPSEDDPNSVTRFEIASRLVAFENLDHYPPKPPELCNTVEGGRYRDFLNQTSPADFRLRLEHICHVAELCR